MNVHRFRQILSVLLVISMMFSLTATAFASGHTESSPPETHVQEIVDGDIFIQRSDSKIVAIATGNTEHILDISILYPSDTAVIYHWLIDDYPVAVFSPNDLSFWTGIIEYVEERIEEADLIESPSVQEITENDPMPLSSAEADLAKSMEAFLGPEYLSKFVASKQIENHLGVLFESLEFGFSKTTTMSWATGLQLSSFIVSVLGIVVTDGTLNTACTILGLITGTASTVVSPGKITRYLCSAIYMRFVRFDGGRDTYCRSYKVMYYDGYEATDGRGRASVFAETGHPYEMNPSEDYYNNGIFYDAYQAYCKG